MTRTVDRAHRSELLDRISDYVLEHGVADLSLRPLAAAVGLSPRTLLHHFASKEAIIGGILQRVRERQMVVFDMLRRAGKTTPRTVCEAAFAYMRDPAIMPAMRLFFETYAMALRDPKRFPRFLERAVGDWLAFLTEPLVAAGMDEHMARVCATITLALYRGLMLDFAAMNDGERVEQALTLAMDALQSLYERKAIDDAQSA